MIPLSPLDHGMTGEVAFPFEFAFHYPGRLSVEALQAGLDRVAEAWWPLGSALEGEERLHLLRGPFPRLEEAEGEDLRGSLPAIHSLPGGPTCGFRLLHTAAGSVLVVAMSHAVVDGASAFLFLSSWARACRGKDFLTPFLDRSVLAAEPADAPDPAQVQAQLGVAWTPGLRRAATGARLWDRFEVEAERLAAWATEAEATEADALAAALARAAGPAWHPGQKTLLTFPVDWRARLPFFHPLYLGNAVGMVAVEVEAALADTARRVRERVEAVDWDRAREALACAEGLHRAHGLRVYEEVHIAHPTRGLLVSNLSRVPLKQLDFGLGPPVEVTPLTDCPRLAFVLPAPRGVKVHVCRGRDLPSLEAALAG